MVLVKRKELSFAEKLYLPQVFHALSMTLRAMFKPKITRQYPEEPLPTTPVVTRGQPRLAVNDEDGTIRCVSCGLCEAACPAYAITIDGQETDRFIEREPERFDIDMLRCILCGFCEEACPKDAIFMSNELELADFTREALVYDMEKLKRPRLPAAEAHRLRLQDQRPVAELLFYLLSAGALGFGAGVISAKNPLYSVLCLLGCFVCLAGVYLVLGFQFLAAAQLIVYAGAIMVLFLFVVMLLNLGDVEAIADRPTEALGNKRVLVAGGAAALLAIAGLIAARQTAVHAAGDTSAAETLATPPPGGHDSVVGIATALFSKYALAFQAGGMLLLVAMIAVIVLAKRERGATTSDKLSRAGRTELSLGDPQP